MGFKLSDLSKKHINRVMNYLKKWFMKAISLSMMATTALLRLAFQTVSYPVMSLLLMLHLRPNLKVIMDGLTRTGDQASLL